MLSKGGGINKRASFFLLTALGFCAALLAAQQQSRSDPPGAVGNPSAPAGQKIFAASCASCHGLDGRGGERAPGIAGSARLQRMPDADIAAIISHGISDTGMPAFRALTPDQVQAVVGHVRFLQGQNKAQPLPGEPVRGKAVFLGKGECSSCHMVRGEGGFLGPDLSTYGAARSAKDVADAITNPHRIPYLAYRAAVVTTRDGHRLSGIVRNEDNFSVQLQTADGAFHFLSRSTLQKLEYQDRPLMPRNYGERLERSELDDLVSYLVSTGRSAKPDANSEEEDLREDDFKD